MIVDKIAERAGLQKEEVQRRIDAKRAKLSDLISKEGAAQIVAAELGISFDNERLKLKEILPGMKKVNVVGKVIKLFPVRSFERKGQENKVANFLIADDTSNVKVVLWDTNHIELIERSQVKEGSVVEIMNGSARDGEVHLGSFSELKLSTEVIENPRMELVMKEKEINEFRVADNVKTRAFIVQIFPPRFFESKQNPGEKGVLLNVVLDDGSETIRAVIFNDTIKKLGLGVEPEEENAGIFNDKKDELLGKEMVFAGNVRKNKMFENLEFVIDNVNQVNLDELISVLEKR